MIAPLVNDSACQTIAVDSTNAVIVKDFQH